MPTSTIALLGLLLSLATTTLGSREEMNPRKRQDSQDPTTTTDDPISQLAEFCPDATNRLSVVGYLSCTSSVFQSINLVCNPQVADCDCAFTRSWIVSCATSVCPPSIASLFTSDLNNCQGGLFTSGLTALETSTPSPSSEGATSSQTETPDPANGHKDEDKSLSTGAIIGIAVAAFVIGVTAVGGFVILLFRHRRKNKKTEYNAVNTETNTDPTTPGFPPDTPGLSPGMSSGYYGYYHQTPGRPGEGYPNQTPMTGYMFDQKPETPTVGAAEQQNRLFEVVGEGTRPQPIYEVSGDGSNRR